MSGSKGVYFLANDRVLDLTIAFLNSLRCHNPDIPLCLVPFDKNIDRINRLQSKYHFEIYDDHDVLSYCDYVSRQFHAQPVGHYRKVAIWEGAFDEFIYIDVDTIILEQLDFAFQFLSDYECLTSHSNLPHLEKWVWKPSIVEVGTLSPGQISYAANTGFIVSCKRMMTLEQIADRMSAAVSLAPHMELFCNEQPLLNYLIVTSGKRYSSLLNIALQSGRADIPLEVWAGVWFANIRGGRLLRPPDKPAALLVHWAGEWHRRVHEANPLWRFYHDLDPAVMVQEEQCVSIGSFETRCEHCGQPLRKEPRNGR